MVTLYNCKRSGDQYRITKFDSDWNPEASYLLDATTCECPAGHRPTCRHRQMLPKFIQREHISDNWFLDFDRGGWVQGWKEEPSLDNQNFMVQSASAALPIQPETEPSLTIATEVRLPDDATPDQVAEAFGNLLALKGLGQASEPSPLRFDKDYSNSIGYSPAHLALGGFPDWCLSSGECTTPDDCILNGCAHDHGTPPRSLAPARLGMTDDEASEMLKQPNEFADKILEETDRIEKAMQEKYGLASAVPQSHSPPVAAKGTIRRRV